MAHKQDRFFQEAGEFPFVYAELSGSVIAAEQREGMMRYDLPTEGDDAHPSVKFYEALANKADEVMIERGIKNPKTAHVFEANVNIGDRKCILTSIKAHSERLGEIREIVVRCEDDGYHIVASYAEKADPNGSVITSALTADDLIADIVAIRIG